MRILPVSLGINKGNYSTNTFDKNFFYKNNFVDNVSFGNKVAGTALDAVNSVNINKIIAHGDELITKLNNLLQRKDELRRIAYDIVVPACTKITKILKDNDLYAFQYGCESKAEHHLYDQFFILMERFNGTTKRRVKCAQLDPLSPDIKELLENKEKLERYRNSLKNQNSDKTCQVVHTLTLKSDTYPDSELVLYAKPYCDTGAIFGINSYKDSDINLINFHENALNRDYLKLVDNPTLETEFGYTFGYSEIKLGIYGDTPMIDKENNITYHYDNYYTKEIVSDSDNLTYNLADKQIIEQLPDKKVIYHLSDDMKNTSSVEFCKN